jgi:hypothetical protein
MKIKMTISLLILGLLTSGLVYPVGATETLPETQSEIHVTGVLCRLKPVITGSTQGSSTNSSREYQLKLDKPIVFSEGTKSERSVSELKLMVPEALQDKVLKLEGRHVMVQGTMHCIMYFSPWTAVGDVLVKKIALQD